MIKTNTRKNKTQVPLLSLSMIIISFALSFIALIWFALATFETIHRIKYVIPAINRAIELRGHILLLGEVLTMSARMHALTDDDQWEIRYGQYEPQLTQYLQELRVIVSKKEQEQRLEKKTEAANTQLVLMERNSFQLVHQGKSHEAKELLLSPGYEEQKIIFTASMNQLFDLLQQQMTDELYNKGIEANVRMDFILIIFISLIFIGVLFFMAFHRWKINLESALAANFNYEKELEAAKRDLEDKVQQRMADLQATNRELTQSLNKIQNLQRIAIQSDKMAVIGQMSAGLAHEINNPLGFIMSNIHTLKGEIVLMTQLLAMYQNLINELQVEESSTLPAGTPIQQTIRSNTFYIQIHQLNQDNDIQAMVDDFDSLFSETIDGLMRIKTIVSKLSELSNLHNQSKELININDCIESAIGLVWNKLKYKTVLNKRLAELPLIMASTNQLMLVFMNLLLNAVEAIETEGEITVVSKVVKAMIVVTVSDNGCGIAPEHLPKLFSPFFTTKNVNSNMGLGLSTSYAIIQLHGGHIIVNSRLGKGTTFTIELPIDKIKQ